MLVFFVFFLSGASGLIFEVLWTRQLGLVFGSTTLAMATVLGAFMGGLALGSHAAGRLMPRLGDPLRAYALCEAGVGGYALLIPWLLRAYPALNGLLWQTLGNHPVLLTALRFVAVALLLLPPTTMMGATLPLLLQFLVRYRGSTTAAHASVQAGALMALNTAGAVAGTFAAGFVLLPRCGVRTTYWLATSINLSLAAVVLLACRRLRTPARPPEHAGRLPQPPPTAMRRLAVACYAVSGAVAMVYQVLWTRALAIVLGSSVYSFTLILLAFLIGLSGGAALATRLLPRLQQPVLALGLCHLLTLVLALVSHLTIDKLPALFLALLRGGTFSPDGLIFIQFLLAALAILPTTTAMGGVMPLTMRLYTASPTGAGRDVGTAYALNTIGAIVGSVAAGFLVLPALGVERGLLGCMVLTLSLGVVLLLCSERPRLGLVLGAAATTGTALFVGLAPRWSLEHFSAGLFRLSIASDIIQHEKWPVPQLLYYHDGIATTVSVERWQTSLALKNNGKVDASNSDDMPTQIMVGLMPLLLHPRALDRPPTVAVIGYGSGVTAGAITQFPIARADVVELEPAVVEAGDRFFGSYNHHASKDPRVRIVIEDGRNFLARPGPAYDVIVSEPSNPWITGVSSLFTVDYWRLARERLADDGVFCQWAQLYEMSQRNIKTLLRSFSAVFPYAYAFSAEDLSSDVILVASKRPLPLDLARLERNFSPQHPRLRAELERAGVRGAEDLLGYLLLVPDELAAFAAGAPINTDDNAIIEFAAPRDLLSYLHHDPYVEQLYGAQWPYGRFERYLAGHGSPFIPPGQRGSRADSYGRLAYALLAHGKLAAAQRLLRRAQVLGGGPQAERVERLLRLLLPRKETDDGPPLTAEGGPSGAGGLEPPRLPPGLGPQEEARIGADYALLLAEMAERRWAHALRALRTWPMAWIEAMGPDLRLLLGYLLYRADLLEEAVAHLRPLASQEAYVARRPALLYYLGRAEYMSARTRDGVMHLEGYLARKPDG
ncbi:MAG: hypothetical protein RMK29_20065 [Myxococcales bacterium]|nr:hypothetical protein [Myxococcales bacterium]